MNPTMLKAAGIALALSAPLTAQERPVAMTGVRILSMAGAPIESGTVLLRDGKIEAVGTRDEVEIPPGARVIEAATGTTVMPGLVSAFSRAGLTSRPSSVPQRQSRSRGFRRPRGGSSRGSSTAKNEAAKKVTDQLYARQDVFGELLEQGVTTLALAPRGSGFPGQGALLDLAAREAATIAEDDTAFVVVAPQPGGKNKKVVKDALAAAAKVVEERKKPAPKAEPAKKEEKPPEKKVGEDKPEKAEAEKKEEKPPEKKEPPKEGEEKKQKEAEKKPEAAKKQPPKKKDPNVEVLADLIEGKTRGLLEISSAFQLVHFLDCAGDTRFPKAAFVAASNSSTQGRLDEHVDKLKDWKAPVLTSMGLTAPAFGAEVINPAAQLAAQGVEVGFLLSDSKSGLRSVFYDLMENVRWGLDRDKALAAVTLVPAKALGVEDRVGSLAAGKDANLLVLSGDPLDPTSRLVEVWYRGRRVGEESK